LPGPPLLFVRAEKGDRYLAMDLMLLRLRGVVWEGGEVIRANFCSGWVFFCCITQSDQIQKS